MICIFSYNRPVFLLSLLKELQGKDDIIVLDDGSYYDANEHAGLCDYYRSKHYGKEGFWCQWQNALDLCKESGHDWFLFIQDDLRDVQYDKLKATTKRLRKYAFNVVNMGPDRNWTRISWKDKVINGVNCWEMSYVDCMFATNRKTLDLLEWKMNPVNPDRFINPNISSGVGQQLSQRFASAEVPMYLPKRSFAYHGSHHSEMNTQERIRNPLISV